MGYIEIGLSLGIFYAIKKPIWPIGFVIKGSLELFWRTTLLVTSTYMLKANSKELLMRIFEKNYTIFFYKKIYTLFSDFTQGASRILRDRVLTH
jgi:hypothetical protein